MAKNTQQKITIERQGGATVVKIYPVEEQSNALETSTNSTAVAQTPVDIMVNENQPSSKVATLQQSKNETITVTNAMAETKPIEVFADKKTEDKKTEEKKTEEKKPEEKKILNCVSAECDYGPLSPLGRGTPYE